MSPRFKSGISENHLNNFISNSHLVTSIVKFHVHYQMEKFMKNPKLLDHLLTDDDLYITKKYMPVHETWERRTLSSHANVGTWYYGLPADTRKKYEVSIMYGPIRWKVHRIRIFNGKISKKCNGRS
ncbi:Hypothetical predicted protein [Paramuricea clavata]|uniref:Uncharacterized protein n=1 Tax=Paramuricea clavata TaxID=317549 RepID=A0A7D9DRY4_PARCT|nr:Hypothetical predicted protein [Paramuricea clavata]